MNKVRQSLQITQERLSIGEKEIPRTIFDFLDDFEEWVYEGQSKDELDEILEQYGFYRTDND